MLETLIAERCGPALAGIKPGNLAACCVAKIPDLKKRIKKLNKELNNTGIYLEILCECPARALLFVYREKQLKNYLWRPEIRVLLNQYGYGDCHSVSDYISQLKSRLNGFEFPHEIGAFLGYPAHDIYGFIHHKDTGCLLCGEWKVYKNPESAKILFARYKKCRCAILKKLADGQTLTQIFCTA